jgi:hypothetical protein
MGTTPRHTYVDDGVYVLTASVTDDVALTGADTRTITIANAAPVATAETGLSAGDGFPFTLMLTTFTDGGASDTHTASIDWGDGTTTAGTVDASLGTVTGTHAYLDFGNHIATVTITDSDGGSVDSVVTIFIFNPPPVPGMTAWGMPIATAMLAIAYGWAWRRRTARAA